MGQRRLGDVRVSQNAHSRGILAEYEETMGSSLLRIKGRPFEETPTKALNCICSISLE